MTEPINIPIDMKVRAKATLNLTNTKTGEVQTMSMGAPEGMILNHYLDWAMERGLGLLGETTFNRCYLGTGDTPVHPTDTGLSGSQLAMSSSGVTTKVVEESCKLELINEIEHLGVYPNNQLAITPDEEILLVGSTSTEEMPGLRAFLVNKPDWTLTPLQIPDFAEFEVPGITCQALSCGGDYLFVGLDQTPNGKIYKRIGNNFSFIGDVPNLTGVPSWSVIAEDGTVFVVDGRVYRLKESSGDIDIVFLGFPGNAYAWYPGDFLGSSSEFCFNDHDSTYSRLVVYKIEEDSISYYFQSPPLSGTNRFYGLVYKNDAVYVARQTAFSDQNTIWKFPRISSGAWGSQIVLTPNFSPTTSIGILQNKPVVIGLGNFVVLDSTSGDIKIVYSDLDDRIAGGTNRTLVITPLTDTVLCALNSNGPPSLGVFQLRDEFNRHQSYARKWTFPAGTGTGVVNEVAIQATSGTGSSGNNRYFLRFVLPEGFEKTDLHQLEVEVEAEIENPGVWEGVIPEGSRDGSDVSYRITMSEGQFRDFIETGYNNLSTWFGTSGTPNVRIGTSNEDTDLVLDRENIRGEEIQYISSTAIREVIPYVSGSLERTIRLFLEINQGNGKIGEIVFGNRFCRVTFDPPLNKYDPEGVDEGIDPSTRLYMNLVFGWKREEE